MLASFGGSGETGTVHDLVDCLGVPDKVAHAHIDGSCTTLSCTCGSAVVCFEMVVDCPFAEPGGGTCSSAKEANPCTAE